MFWVCSLKLWYQFSTVYCKWFWKHVTCKHFILLESKNISRVECALYQFHVWKLLGADTGQRLLPLNVGGELLVHLCMYKNECFYTENNSEHKEEHWTHSLNLCSVYWGFHCFLIVHSSCIAGERASCSQLLDIWLGGEMLSSKVHMGWISHCFMEHEHSWKKIWDWNRRNAYMLHLSMHCFSCYCVYLSLKGETANRWGGMLHLHGWTCWPDLAVRPQLLSEMHW